MMAFKISIVVPVYQNENNIESTIIELLSLAKEIRDADLELVLVNDGSTDGSLKVIREAMEKAPQAITLVNFTKNFGQNTAIREGLKVATGDCVGIISADLQDPPELFLEMFDHWKSGFKLVIAERTGRDESLAQAFVSGFYWRMVSHFAIEGFPKGGFDFCLLDRQVVGDLNKIGEKHIHFSLIFWLGYKVKLYRTGEGSENQEIYLDF